MEVEESVVFDIETVDVDSIDQLIKVVLNISKSESENSLYFRGENSDYGEMALTPSVYRNFQEKEHHIFREMQRFNDHEFSADKTAFDKLARMQHYQAPTRILDVSEDVLSALYFALNNAEKSATRVVYALEIDRDCIKYYDSDAASVVANLAKSPLITQGEPEKSKSALHRDANTFLFDRVAFNQQKSVNFLLHDIGEEKSYFRAIVDPAHLFSVFLVKPKYTNQRLLGQKGAFLLFGLNQDCVEKPIQLLQKVKRGNEENSLRINSSLSKKFHPLRKITKIRISCAVKMDSLAKLGISTPCIYPEMDWVAEFLKQKSASDNK